MILDRVSLRRRGTAIGVALFPLVFLVLSELLRARNPELYTELFKEDGLVESAQAIMYFAAALLAFSLGRAFLARGDRVFAAFYVLLGIGLVFITGEEISWGQRILLFDTPSYFQAHNLQDELNLHNLVELQHPDGSTSWFDVLYSVAFGYAVLAWALVPGRLGARLGERVHFLVVSWFLAPYILADAWRGLCAACTQWAGPPTFEMQEAGELLVAMGALLFVALGRRRLRAMSEDDGRASSDTPPAKVPGGG